MNKIHERKMSIHLKDKKQCILNRFTKVNSSVHIDVSDDATKENCK